MVTVIESNSFVKVCLFILAYALLKIGCSTLGADDRPSVSDPFPLEVFQTTLQMGAVVVGGVLQSSCPTTLYLFAQPKSFLDSSRHLKPFDWFYFNLKVLLYALYLHFAPGSTLGFFSERCYLYKKVFSFLTL